MWRALIDLLSNLGNSPRMAVDLDTYRKSHGLTWRQLAERIGAATETQARRWALGMEWPRDPERLEAICKACGHEVDVYSMHLRRLEWVRATRRPVAGTPAAEAPAAESDDQGAKVASALLVSVLAL